MISSTAAFNTAVEATSRHFDARIKHNGSVVQCDITHIKTKKGACDGDYFSIGSVYSSSIEIEACNLTTPLENEDITLEIGIKEGDTYEYVEYGHYTVIKAPKTTKQITISAVGFITSKLTTPISLSASAPTINQIIAAIGTASGVTVTVPNGGTLALNQSVDGMNARTALELVASLLGCYATETNTGAIAVKKFEIPVSKVTVTGDRCLTEPTTQETFTMTGVKVIVTPEEIDDEGAVIPEVEYHTSGVIRQIYENEYMTQAIFNQFASNIVGYTFTPASVDLSLGDPRIEPWDCLSVTDEDGDTFNVPCHVIESSFDGGFASEILSTGESETESEPEGSLTKRFNELSGQLATTEIAADKAKAAASSAQSSADAAAAAASSAQGSATAAAAAASVADGKAEAASAAASVADGKAVAAAAAASSAQSSANTANTYANAALDQLGVVQDVIGVLSWASEHGSFTLTSDTTIQSGKVYFTYDAQTGDYTPVAVPTASALSTYYELEVDEAMNSFIMAHLAVTARGLWVLPSGLKTGSVTPASGETEADARGRLANNYKVLLSSNGMYVYDGDGALVSTFGENITFSSTRAQYIGGENAYIIFNPTTGQINIGGSGVIFGGDKPLSQVLNDLATAENTLIYDHTYEVSNGVASFTAFLYKGGVDVKSSYDPTQFTWYLKTEDGTTALGSGYTTTVNINACGYGAEVIGKFTISDDAELLTSEGDNLTNNSGTNYTVRASGDSVRVSDLEVVTTIYDTDKLLIVGGEGEHLVTFSTLQDYLNAHLDSHVLFNTTTGWDSQITLVSQTNTIYVYTDHDTDSDGNNVAGIKVGDGNAYVVDLPFTDAIAMEHIADNTRHITSSERDFWNNKVRCYYAGTEQLIFTTA